VSSYYAETKCSNSNAGVARLHAVNAQKPTIVMDMKTPFHNLRVKSMGDLVLRITSEKSSQEALPLALASLHLRSPIKSHDRIIAITVDVPPT
jgi:hypothetical protein